MATEKATWWSITTFDDGEQKYLSGSQFPEWVARVYGGLEKCPDTGRIHFQGALQCRSQQRFSAIKKWLPKAHLEPAISRDALRKYAMKQETACGPKTAQENKTPYYTLEMLLKLIAIQPIDLDAIDWKKRYWVAVNKILRDKPYLVGALVKPDTMRAWEHTHWVWIDLMTDKESGRMKGEEAIVLQPPSAQDAELISHV